MALLHAQPAEVVNVGPLGNDLAATQTTTLVKTDAFKVIRMVIPVGKEIPTHKAKGDITVQCLEGKIAFSACGKTQNLESGKLFYLPTGEPHSLIALEDSSMLLTVLLPKG